MRTRIIIAAALLGLGFAVMALTNPDSPPPTVSPEPETQPVATRERVEPVALPRGQLLYENHCLSCHESMVHIRSKQTARSLPDLHAKVRQWADYLHLPWGNEEVADVTRFLDSRYYRFESRP